MKKQIVEQLKSRAELMGKYYFRGFGNCLAGTSASASNCVHYPESIFEMKKHALDSYSFIEELYQKIPFEELKDNEDFKPIFSARTLLSEYKEVLNSLLEDPSNEKEKRLYELNRIILQTVEPYRWNFWGLTKKIRKIPGNENFFFKVVDWNGHEWRF